jgi:MFS family permease
VRAGRVLLALPLLDELTGGLSVAGAPELHRAAQCGVLTLGTALLAVPMLASVLEAPVLAWTDRVRARRSRVVAAGLAGMALSLGLCALARGPAGLSLATLVYAPCSGIALGTAEAMLIDRAGADAPRLLARWTAWAAVGDVLAPTILGLAAAWCIPWRWTFVGGALGLFLGALGALALPGEASAPAEADDGEVHAPLGASLRAALTHPRVALWLLGAALCTLLDELLATYAALRVTASDGAGWSATSLGAFSLGGVLGAVALERALQTHSPRALLTGSAVLCTLAYLGWLVCPMGFVSVALFFLSGAGAAAMHPLAMAEAFRALPGRPGLVAGAGQAFVAVDLLGPVVLGVVTEHAGLLPALSLLLLQPLGMLLLAPRASPRPGAVDAEAAPAVAEPP